MYYRNRVPETTGKDCGHQQGRRVEEGHLPGYLHEYEDEWMPECQVIILCFPQTSFTSKPGMKAQYATQWATCSTYGIFATIGLTRICSWANVQSSMHGAYG